MLKIFSKRSHQEGIFSTPLFRSQHSAVPSSGLTSPPKASFPCRGRSQFLSWAQTWVSCEGRPYSPTVKAPRSRTLLPGWSCCHLPTQESQFQVTGQTQIPGASTHALCVTLACFIQQVHTWARALESPNKASSLVLEMRMMCSDPPQMHSSLPQTTDMENTYGTFCAL